MHILIGYGDAPGTTGQYLEETLAATHNTVFVGGGSLTRAGYAPDIDLQALVAQIAETPDLLLYVDSGNNAYAPSRLPALSFPTIAYFMDAYPPGIAQRTPYLETLAPLFDYLFVAHRAAIPFFQKLRPGAPLYWLPPCCDPAVHGDQRQQRIYDVGFVGQVNDSYPDRVRLLNTLERQYRMNDFRRRYYRQELAHIYSQSKIVINISHTDQIIPMRFFEAPAAGAMLLTQRSRSNGQDELMREGSEYVSFDTIEDALEKVAYYLAHPHEREQIAAAGQQAVLANHTYAQRVAQLLQTVQADGMRHHAPARRWSQEQVRKCYLQAYSQLRLVDCVMEQKGAPILERLRYALPALLRRIKHER